MAQSTEQGTPIPSIFEGRLVERGTESGVEWFTALAPINGSVNGYALLPEGHPWRDLDLQGSDCDSGPDVHGGVTYGPTPSGWVGFDTAHSGDVWPGQEYDLGYDTEWDVHWTNEKVADEARELARQIAEVSR